MKKCTGKYYCGGFGCKIVTRQDFMDDWVARCVSHENHKHLSGISRYEKVAVRILKDAVRMTSNMEKELWKMDWRTGKSI